MSGARLYALLQQLGCPDMERMSPDGLEWVLHVDGVGAMLRWMCDNLSPANVLTDEELRLYVRAHGAETAWHDTLCSQVQRARGPAASSDGTSLPLLLLCAFQYPLALSSLRRRATSWTRPWTA